MKKETFIMKRNLIKVFVFFIIVLVSCTKDNPEYFCRAFPNEVGDHWRYRVSVPWHTSADYTDVSIVGTCIINRNQQATVLTGWDIYDTCYVVSDNQSTRIYLKTDDSVFSNGYYIHQTRFFEIFRFLFPLQTGNKWIGDFGDTLKAERIEKVVVPAGVFSDTYMLVSNDGMWLKDTLWYKSGIGMIKRHKTVHVDIDHGVGYEYTVELDSYQIH